MFMLSGKKIVYCVLYFKFIYHTTFFLFHVPFIKSGIIFLILIFFYFMWTWELKSWLKIHLDQNFESIAKRITTLLSPENKKPNSVGSIVSLSSLSIFLLLIYIMLSSLLIFGMIMDNICYIWNIIYYFCFIFLIFVDVLNNKLVLSLFLH